jgi:YfiR/HmsC-like
VAFLSQASRIRCKQPDGGHPGFSVICRISLFCLPILLCCIPPIRAQSEGPTEYQVKAAFVYNFAKFVEWPTDAFSDSSAPLRFCVLGESLVSPDLSQITQGKLIGGHPIQVLQNSRNLRDCHVLFISASHNVAVKDIQEGLRGVPVLTVGESRDFAAQGGMIGFVMENARVRFEVNLQAAKQMRLNISSKLLSLAKKVLT